jgi:hypothetical protein
MTDAFRAEVAELADALDSGSSARKGVGVRVPASAPNLSRRLHRNAFGAHCSLRLAGASRGATRRLAERVRLSLPFNRCTFVHRGQVRIAFDHLQPIPPAERLHRQEIDPGHDKTRGEGVAEGVERYQPWQLGLPCPCGETMRDLPTIGKDEWTLTAPRNLPKRLDHVAATTTGQGSAGACSRSPRKAMAS